MLSNITKLNIAEHIKTAKKKDKSFINASTVDEYIRNKYKCIDIDYGAVKIVKIILGERYV